MKFLVVMLLLGISLNQTQAEGPELSPVTEAEVEESQELKFTTLVKSTMDLLGPVEETEVASSSDEDQTSNPSKTLSQTK